MIRDWLYVFYGRLRDYKEYLRLKRRFKSKGGILGQPLKLLNPGCIKIGRNVRIKKGYRLECYKQFAGKELNPQLILGDGVIIGPNFTGFIADLVNIKSDTILAGNVTLVSENHGMNPESDIPYHAQPLETGPITIGESCWIGQNVCILRGVNIGDKCVIASNAVVTKDIPSYSIAAGVPAKVIKKFNFETHRWESLTR